MADIFNKIAKDPSLKAARMGREMGIYPYFGRLSETEGTEVIVEGRRLIMIGSNNYLGLTTHPKVRQAAIDAINHFGTSCTGSRFLNGTLEIHLELERRLAKFMGKEAAIIFGTGYQSNLGAITALMGSEDIAVCDKEVHACIVDGSEDGWLQDEALASQRPGRSGAIAEGMQGRIAQGRRDGDGRWRVFDGWRLGAAAADH